MFAATSTRDCGVGRLDDLISNAGGARLVDRPCSAEPCLTFRRGRQYFRLCGYEYNQPGSRRAFPGSEGLCIQSRRWRTPFTTATVPTTRSGLPLTATGLARPPPHFRLLQRYGRTCLTASTPRRASRAWRFTYAPARVAAFAALFLYIRATTGYGRVRSNSVLLLATCPFCHSLPLHRQVPGSIFALMRYHYRRLLPHTTLDIFLYDIRRTVPSYNLCGAGPLFGATEPLFACLPHAPSY